MLEIRLAIEWTSLGRRTEAAMTKMKSWLLFWCMAGMNLGCGGNSMRSLTFDINPSSATIQQGGSQTLTAVNIVEPGVNPMQQVNFDWSIQDSDSSGSELCSSICG